jgi:hypothetical protein
VEKDKGNEEVTRVSEENERLKAGSEGMETQIKVTEFVWWDC